MAQEQLIPLERHCPFEVAEQVLFEGFMLHTAERFNAIVVLAILNEAIGFVKLAGKEPLSNGLFDSILLNCQASCMAKENGRRLQCAQAKIQQGRRNRSRKRIA